MISPDPFENVQALIGAPRTGQHHALGAVGHDPLEPPVRGADRKRAVHQGLVVISREGGDPGRAHPAERLRRRIACALAEIDQFLRPLPRGPQMAPLERIEAEQEIGQALEIRILQALRRLEHPLGHLRDGVQRAPLRGGEFCGVAHGQGRIWRRLVSRRGSPNSRTRPQDLTSLAGSMPTRVSRTASEPRGPTRKSSALFRGELFAPVRA